MEFPLLKILLKNICENVLLFYTLFTFSIQELKLIKDIKRIMSIHYKRGK